MFRLFPMVSNSRAIHPFHENYTNSLAICDPDFAYKAGRYAETRPAEAMYALVQKNAASIREHAQRRGELYFFLMLALHNINDRAGTFVDIRRAGAKLQHGCGSLKRLTEACHSSLIPDLLIYACRRAGRERIFQEFNQTSFYHSLNGTVELPCLVNRIDSELENSNEMLDFLQILKDVANSKLDPVAGMQRYHYVMEQFFDSAPERFNEIDSTELASKARQAVLTYQREGTFVGANDDSSMRDDYLGCLLRASNADVSRLKQDKTLLNKYYQRLQDEIWHSNHDSSRKLRMV